jgi:hypothetical protein
MLTAAGRASAVLGGVATLVVVASLVTHGREFASVAGDYRGATGSLAMVVFSLLAIPNAVVFGVSYLTGASFAVGTGTSVSLGSSHLGAVPAFPLLAAVPSGGAPVPVIVVGVAAVLAAGAVAGWRIAMLAASAERARERLSRIEQVRAAVMTAAVMGVGAAILALYAGGAAGPGRMRSIGPSPWELGLIVTAEIAVTATAAVLVAGLRHPTPTRRTPTRRA